MAGSIKKVVLQLLYLHQTQIVPFHFHLPWMEIENRPYLLMFTLLLLLIFSSFPLFFLSQFTCFFFVLYLSCNLSNTSIAVVLSGCTMEDFDVLFQCVWYPFCLLFFLFSSLFSLLFVIYPIFITIYFYTCSKQLFVYNTVKCFMLLVPPHSQKSLTGYL